MSTLLHILVSARGELSHSRAAGSATVARLLAEDPALVLRERDLGATPLPHPDAAFVRASLMPAELRGAAEHERLALSEQLIAELAAADVVVVSTPLHNFTIPSVLKAWLDHIVRPGCTFGFSPEGKVGLLQDKPLRVLLACGGPLGEGGQPDFVTPYLRHVFGSIGIADLQVHALQKLNPAATAAEVRQLHAGPGWIGRAEAVAA